MDLKSKIRVVEDFPKKGISFKDMSTLLKDKDALREMVDQMVNRLEDYDFDYVVGVEARGFLVGMPIAYNMHKGFITVRKPGKIPGEIMSEEYALEYGTNTIEMDANILKPGDKVVIVDDLLATGGTLDATIKLVERAGAEVVAVGFLVELTGLKGREENSGYDIFSLVDWEY